MAEVFKFKAASIGGGDNEIVISCQGNVDPTDNFIVENRNQAYYLAQRMHAWLTPDTVSRIIEELKYLGH